MIVKVYPYKTAYVPDPFLTVPRENLKDFEEMLVEEVSHPLVITTDNHVVYEVHDIQNITYIYFTDNMVKFGRTLRLTNNGGIPMDKLPLWKA